MHRTVEPKHHLDHGTDVAVAICPQLQDVLHKIRTFIDALKEGKGKEEGKAFQEFLTAELVMEPEWSTQDRNSCRSALKAIWYDINSASHSVQRTFVSTPHGLGRVNKRSDNLLLTVECQEITLRAQLDNPGGQQPSWSGTSNVRAEHHFCEF